MIHLVEGGRIEQVREPSAGPNNNTQDGTFVNLSDAQFCFIVANIAEGDAANYTLTIRETDGTTPQNIANTVQVFSNLDTATNDLMTRQANAASLAVAGSTLNKLVVFAIDPDRLSDGYDSVTLRVDSTAGAQDARNQIIGAVAYVLPARYKNPR
jgi:hypothetical protein